MRFEQEKIQVSTGTMVQFRVAVPINKRLIAVELLETDSTGASVDDLGNIGLVYSEAGILTTLGGLSMNLKAGHFGPGNSLLWQGDVPITQPIKLMGTFNFPTAGNICYLRYMMIETEEIGGGMASPTNVVQTYPLGVLKILHVVGTADALTLPFRPPANYQWLVQFAQCYHDDGSSRTVGFQLTDGTSTFSLGQLQSVAATSRTSMGQYHSGSSILIYNINGFLLTRAVYAQVLADALTAGKHLILDYAVLEFAGGV